MSVIPKTLQTKNAARKILCVMPFFFFPYPHRGVGGKKKNCAHAPAHAHALYYVFACIDSLL